MNSLKRVSFMTKCSSEFYKVKRDHIYLSFEYLDFNYLFFLIIGQNKLESGL